MSTDNEMWHIVEAKRDDGTPTMFRIRELDPKKDLTKIFVVELPYSTAEMSRLPNAAAYRRAADLEEQWLRPACQTLGWELVGSKTEDGSFFLYMYGGGDPSKLIEKLSPFDAGLGFYDDDDPEWHEYGTLRELLDQAKAMNKMKPAKVTNPATKAATASAAKAKAKKPARKKQPAKNKPAKRKPASKKKATKRR
ncbi:MAG TPA: DUF695 domain-containing protein [Kofleriaceae bacterium]|jgi:hypothetical protein|nr:DUF695 domain-containing protein [Kofleriaceae bacterium]